jgi:uncharacterized RDD family membrane protein YckC
MGREMYGGFWIRFIAYCIDNIICSLFSLALGTILLYTPLSFWITILLQILICFVVYSLYEIVLTARFGGTVGKLLVRLRVEDGRGRNLSYGKSTGRYFAKIISGLLLGIGYLMIAWDRKRQGLHDKIADTFVKKRTKSKVSKQVSIIVIVIAVLVVVGYIVYITAQAVAGFTSALYAGLHPLDKENPLASLQEHCRNRSWDACVSAYVTFGNSTLSLRQMREACSQISGGYRAACVQAVVRNTGDASDCGMLKSSYYRRQCEKSAAMLLSMRSFLGLDDYTPSLRISRMQLGIDQGYLCVGNREEFNTTERICLQPMDVGNFTPGSDGKYHFEMSLRIYDSAGRLVEVNERPWGMDGVVSSRDDILNGYYLHMPLQGWPLGNYTYQLTVYDEIGRKKDAANGTFSVVA